MTQLLQIFDIDLGNEMRRQILWDPPPHLTQSYLDGSLAGGGIILVARTTNAAPGAGRFIAAFDLDSRFRLVVAIVAGGTDRRGQNREIDSLFFDRRRIATTCASIIVTSAAIGPFAARFGTLASGTIVGSALAGGTLTTRLSIASRFTKFTVGTRLPIGTRPRLLALRLLVLVAIIAVAVIVHVRLHAIIAVIVLVIIATALLLVEPRPGIAQHAEIMVGELQIIFGLDAIAGKLGVARHALIFLVQLGGIATLPVIAGVAAAIAGHAAGLLSAAAATAAALTIIDQSEFPRRTGASTPQNLSLAGLF